MENYKPFAGVHNSPSFIVDPYDGKKEKVVSVRGLYKSFSGRSILRDICFDMYGGEVLGLLGPNGSGKTTTIKLMLGLLKMDAGEVSICGSDTKKDFEAAMSNVGAIIENPELYKYMSGLDNLRNFARMYDGITKERIDEVVRIVRLDGRIKDKIAKYSLGMRQRLGIAQAILHKPKVLILDEPTNGLDPAGIKELRDILRDLAENHNVAVMISSHQLTELENICDRVAIIDRGAVVSVKLMSELRDAAEGDGLYNIDIVTTDSEKAAELFISLGYAVEGMQSGISVRAKKEDIPQLTKLMLDGGIPFESLNPRKRSLEDAFMEVTTNYASGGLGI